MRFFIVILSLVIISAGCKKKTTNPEDVRDDFNRSELLSDLAMLIEESQVEYNSQLSSLKDATTSFTNDPSMTRLENVRAHWSTALLKWQAVAPYEFGEASNMAFEASTNIYPVDVNIIQANIDSGDYNLSSAANLKGIGLQAMDYMIHGLAESDDEILNLYSTDSKAEARKEYLNNIASKLYDMSDQVLNSWLPNAQSRVAFVDNDGTDQGSSIGLFLNSFNKSYEKSTRTNKIGIPSGALTFSMNPNPHTVEAYYENNNSLSYLSASIDAFENIYLGSDMGTSSLQDYLFFLDARYGDTTLDAAILNSIEDVRNQISLMDNPLSDSVVNDQQVALDAFASMQNLVVLWKVDMMSAMGILVTYQDNDGD
ncbi:MAG: putative lipoprotein [Patiriisocius sp.]|jgi:predicted lipoprotein